jgi:UDP-glucose 4-epimerase
LNFGPSSSTIRRSIDGLTGAIPERRLSHDEASTLELEKRRQVRMIILFGANGFLGRHTAELLGRRQQRAIAVSRAPDHSFFERFAPALEVMTVAEFASSSGEAAIAEAEALIHFAWGSVPSTFVDQPWRELPANVQPSFELFQRVAAISPRTKNVLLSSGGTIYGSEGTTPKDEAAPTRPISAYGLGKLMTEEGLRFISRTRGAPHAILRVSNSVGRWQTDARQGIVGVGLRAARDSVPVRLFGGGVQVRDFVDADDVADAILRAATDRTHSAATWNVGSGIGVRVIDMLTCISKVIGKSILVEHAPARAIDVPHIVLDCRKIAEDLGWAAKTPIQQSIVSLWKIVCGHIQAGRLG